MISNNDVHSIKFIMWLSFKEEVESDHVLIGHVYIQII